MPPFQNVTPGRSVAVHTVGEVASTFSASSGATVPSARVRIRPSAAPTERRYDALSSAIGSTLAANALVATRNVSEPPCPAVAWPPHPANTSTAAAAAPSLHLTPEI
ncbi:hypothetical protein Pa4123_88910 [Phytohabitans aurantiacus]|uniref:Uncharacterized protein n=1 Tax=Phytohabitans aurantiacus TaxID=3016789 RepID=A0ABQ5RB25_9ACTN|nr:hypothetical protein Pa4123_88910 [Phytohabitans aurantiacus]